MFLTRSMEEIFLVSCISGARFFLPLFLSFLFSMRRSMSLGYYCYYYYYLSGIGESFINDMD